MMRAQGRIARGDRRWLAQLLGKSVRTLQLWALEDPAAVLPPLGRPAYAPEVRRQALIDCAIEMIRQGRISGARPIDAALAHVPTRLVRAGVAQIKQLREQRARRQRAAARLHIEVHLRDVLWSQDATHLGRAQGREVSGEVIRDVATQRRLMLSVGAASSGEDVIRLLEGVFEEHGVLPLVFASDNGPYRAECVEQWLAEHEIVHLKNRPHTPQHNAWSEQGIAELKGESGLGRGVRIEPGELGPQQPIEECSHRPGWAPELDVLLLSAPCEHAPITLGHCSELLSAAWWRLDHERLRASLGYQTAAECYANAQRWYTRVCRERFYREACLAVAQAVAGCSSTREESMAAREAILRTLERFDLIRKTRGGAPLPAPKSEGIS
jgi:hypothetical protein